MIYAPFNQMVDKFQLHEVHNIEIGQGKEENKFLMPN